MSCDSEFTWNVDDNSIAIEQVDAVAVYTNVDGNLVIRQRDSMGGDDSIIVIPKAHASSLTRAINREVDE